MKDLLVQILTQIEQSCLNLECLGIYVYGNFASASLMKLLRSKIPHINFNCVLKILGDVYVSCFDT